MRRVIFLSLIFAALSMSACSGGGGSSSPAPRRTVARAVESPSPSPSPTLTATPTAQSVALVSTPAGQNPSMSFADMTATAECEEEGVVMSYFLFGTPTPTATPIGGLPSPTPELGDAMNGQILFNTDAACFSCHSVNAGEWLVGPSLAGIPARAGERIAGLAAHDYLRMIIRDPDRITPSLIPGIMPRTYAQTLTDRQIEDLVAYLMTLEY